MRDVGKQRRTPVPVRTGRTRSDCRAAPVSQNQVRQREQHIQFGGLFWQTSVSRFSIPELPLYDRKYVFYLSSYRRLLMLRLFCSPLPTCRQLLNLRWLTILLVSDFFALLVPNEGIMPPFCRHGNLPRPNLLLSHIEKKSHKLRA